MEEYVDDVVVRVEAGDAPLRQIQMAPARDDVDQGAKLVSLTQAVDDKALGETIHEARERLRHGVWLLSSVDGVDVESFKFCQVLRLARGNNEDGTLSRDMELVFRRFSAAGDGVTVVRNIGNVGYHPEEGDESGSSEDEGFEGELEEESARKRPSTTTTTTTTPPTRAEPRGRNNVLASEAAFFAESYEEEAKDVDELRALRFEVTAEKRRAARLADERDELRRVVAGLTRRAHAAEASRDAALDDLAQERCRQRRVVDDSKLEALARSNATAQSLDSAKRDLAQMIARWQRAERRAQSAEKAATALRSEAAEYQELLVQLASTPPRFAPPAPPKKPTPREEDLQRLCNRLVQGNADRDDEIALLRATLATTDRPTRIFGAANKKRSATCTPRVLQTSMSSTTT